jgi:hypothetical protein
MSEDKKSSNLPPVLSTGAVGVSSSSANSNRQALFTPQPPEPTETIGSLDVQSHPPSGLSHPYLSSHPTQTFNTDTGDIILNAGEPKSKRNKRPLIIGGMILAVFVVICGVAILQMTGVWNVDASAISLINNNIESIENLETLFYDAKYQKITVGEILNSGLLDKTKQDAARLSQFQKGLSEIDPAQVSEEWRDQFLEVKDRIDTYAPACLQTVGLYSEIYEAYIQGDADKFKEMQNNSNVNIAIIGRRFADYFEFNFYWSDILDKNRRSQNGIAFSEICTEAQDGYAENKETFVQNTPAVQSLFSAYDGTVYTKQKMIYRVMQEIINERSGA